MFLVTISKTPAGNAEPGTYERLRKLRRHLLQDTGKAIQSIAANRLIQTEQSELPCRIQEGIGAAAIRKQNCDDDSRFEKMKMEERKDPQLFHFESVFARITKYDQGGLAVALKIERNGHIPGLIPKVREKFPAHHAHR